LKERQRCLPLLSFSRWDKETLLFRGGKEGPTVVIWESLSEHKKASWLEEASTMHDWVLWCNSKKGAEKIRSFELSGKEISSNYDETKSKEEKNKKNGSKKKAHRGQSVRYSSWWKQGNLRKGRMSNTTDRYLAGILDGHRDWQTRRLRLPRHGHSG